MSKLSDLNTHLFAQLNRLEAAGLNAEQIEQEVKRAGAIVAVADQVINMAQTQLKAAQLFGQFGPSVLPHLPQIGKAE